MGGVGVNRCHVGVQYLGGGLTDVGVNDVGVKGVRDAKESVSCEVSVCEMVVSRRSGRSGRFVRRRCSLNGDVPTRHVVGGTSPCPVEYSCMSGCGSCSVSSRLKRPSVCSPVLPVNGLLEQDQKSMWQGFHCRL